MLFEERCRTLARDRGRSARRREGRAVLREAVAGAVDRGHQVDARRTVVVLRADRGATGRGCYLDRCARDRRKHQEKKSLENFCLQSTPFCPVLPAPICPALTGSAPF